MFLTSEVGVDQVPNFQFKFLSVAFFPTLAYYFSFFLFSFSFSFHFFHQRPRNSKIGALSTTSVLFTRNISTSSNPKMQQQAWEPTMNINNINPCIKTMEYAVRGPLVIRATEIEKEIEQVRILIKFLCLRLAHSHVILKSDVITESGGYSNMECYLVVVTVNKQ